MKNIHVLPTNKKTRLFTSDSELILAGYPTTTFKTGQHIYITSDEEIKEGDWFLHPFNTLHKAGGNVIDKDFRKIILTTDGDLIKEGVQSIDDEFLKWFVKNPSCEEIKIDKNWNYPLDKSWEYKIILPKKETKQETTADYIDRHIVQAMVEVAKQKMYREEEVINIIYKIYDEMGISISLEDVLKQFKK